MCSCPNHMLSQDSQIHLSAFFLCSGSWWLTVSGQSLPDHHLASASAKLGFPPNSGSPGLNRILPVSSAISFLCSDSSFINKAWRLKSFFCVFFFNKINYFHVIYFSLFLNSSTLGVLFVVFWGSVVFGYCLFNEGRAEDTVMSPRHCLWSLEFSFSPSQPCPELPVGLFQSSCSWSTAASHDPLACLGTLNTHIPMLLPRHAQIPGLLGDDFLSLFSSII